MKEIGEELMNRCQQLVINYLDKNPQGATNQQVSSGTGLFLGVPHHKGYISWTILEHLAENGTIEKIQQGNKKVLYQSKKT